MASGERTVRIKFDGNSFGLTKAMLKTRADLEALEKKIETNRSEWAKVTAAAAKLRAELKAQDAQIAKNKQGLINFSAGIMGAAGKLATLAGGLGTLGTGVGAVLALTMALTAMSGAAGLAVPALFGLVGVMAAVKLGADGAKRAFDQLKPTMDTLKSAVSASFEKSLTPAVNNLKVVLPQLTTGLKSIATALGGAATQFTAMLKNTAATSELNGIFVQFSKVIQHLAAWLAPVGQAFITIGAVAAPMLAQLTAGMGAAGERFNAFIQQAAADGSLAAWIQRGIDAFSSLATFLGQVGSIISSVFAAADAAGLGFGGTIGTLVGVVANFLNSFEGQTALLAFFEGIRLVGEAVGGVLAAALTAVAPVIPPLATAFGTLAGQVAAVLVPAIQLLAPLLQGLASFFAANMAWIGPLAIAIGGIALAIQAVTLAVNLWKAAVAAYTVVQWLLNAAMSANPIGLVIAAIVAIIAIIALVISNLDFFRGIWDAVWKWCSDLITSIVDWISQKWEQFKLGFQIIVAAVGKAWDNIVNGIKSVVGTVVDWIVGRWNWFKDTITGIFQGIGSFIGGVWDGIKSGFKNAINGVISFANSAIGAINSVTGAVGIPAIPKIPMLAKGGTAVAGRSYLVGEKGPELFTPGSTGRVTNAATTAEAIGASSAPPVIHVYIGDTELTDIVDVRIEENTLEAARSIRAGSGSYR